MPHAGVLAEFNWFEGGIVVSCQAPVGSPLRSPAVMAAMARAAELAGAMGIRAEGRPDIREIAVSVQLPIIGIRKHRYEGSDVFITATREDVDIVADAGAPVVAIDATPRARPFGERLDRIVSHAHDRGLLVMADLNDASKAAYAVEAGVDALGTTLIPQGPEDHRPGGPNVSAIETLRSQYPILPIVGEGRYANSQDVASAFAAGATTVVIGTAITDAFALAKDLISGLQPVKTRHGL